MHYRKAALVLPMLLGLTASQARVGMTMTPEYTEITVPYTSQSGTQFPVGTGTQSPTHLTITPTFDSSILNDANAATIESSINSAISVYEQDFTNPIDVNIDFKEGGGLGMSSTYYGQVSYKDYRNALTTDKAGTGDTAFLSYLPAGPGNPVNGSDYVNVTTANLRALGFSTSGPQYDSTITLNTSIMNLSRTGTHLGSDYDLQAVASHEIDEALGIGSSLTNPDTYFNNNAIRGLDLFRYSAPGTRSFTTSSAAVDYLSVDGGNSSVKDQYGNPVYFNQTGGGSDYNDFAGSTNARVQDAYGTPGSQPNLGPGELTALQDIGYNEASPAPEPSQVGMLALMGLGLGGLLLRARRRRAQETEE